MKIREIAYRYWPLAILIVVFCALAASFSLLLPLNEAVDEESHFDLVRFIAEQRRFPLTNQERDSLGDKGDASPIYHGLVAVLSQHVDVTSLPKRHLISPASQAIAYDATLTTQDLHTDDELFPFRGIVLAWRLARLVSIPFGALTIVAAYLTALAMYPQQRYFALAVAGFVAFVPRFVFNSAVVTDDNLVIPLVSFAVYYQIRIIQGDERPRAFVILGVVTGLAVITKYHSLVLLPQITLIFLVLAWRNRTEWQRWLKRWVWVILSFAVITGWWFLFLFIRFNRVAELGLVGGLLAPLGDPTTTEIASLQSNSFTIRWNWIAPVLRTFWIIERPLRMPGLDFISRILIVLTVIATLGLLRLTVDRLTSRRPVKWRLDIALLALNMLLYMAIVFGRYQVFVARGTPPPPYSTQGRHLYPAIVSIAFFYVLGWRAALGRFPWRSKSANVASSFNGILAGAISVGLFTLSIVTFFLFVRPSYLPGLPILRLEPDETPISRRANVTFVEGVKFVGYDLKTPSRAENILSVQLYWQANGTHERDYIARLCLRDGRGDPISCHWGYPANGLYPTRAWDVGYLIRDERTLPIPACLSAGSYDLTLTIRPLRNDVAATVLDEIETIQKPLSLGSIALSHAPPQSRMDILLCTADGCITEGQVKLPRIRQTLTVVSYQDVAGQTADESVRFVLNDAAPESSAEWLPFQSSDIFRCSPGQTFQTHTFIVDPSVTPGAYTLDIDNQLEEAFLVEVGTHPRNFDSPPDPETNLDISFADQLILLGYNVDLSPHWPDDPIEVITFWEAKQKMTHNYNAALHLLDNAQETQGLYDHFLGGLYPNTLWMPGEFVQDIHVIQGSKSGLLPGLYTLELRVYDYSQGRFERLPVTELGTDQRVESNPILGQVRIMDPARTRSPEHAKSVDLGQEIELLGYDLANTQTRPGGSVSLALHWQAIAQPSTDYTVFTQLIGPDGLVWGQQDNQPQQGRYPTTAWPLRDRLVDRYDISLRDDAPEGSYILVVGMYDLATGERLPAVDDRGNRFSNDAIILGTVDVVREP